MRHCGDMSFALSVLDQSPISAGSTGGDALRNSIDLARHAEALGYERYWIAEHHGTPMLASAAPEILIAAVAAATSRIRVGSGGVMLPHYCPLKVAEVFSMLAAAAPGPDRPRPRPRARQRPADDVRAPARPPPGLARRLPGAARRAARLPEDDFPAGPSVRAPRCAAGRRRSGPRCGCSAPRRRARSGPASSACPTSSPTSSTRAGAEIARALPRALRPVRRRDAPFVGVALSVVCAETDDEAERLASSSRMAMTLLRQGRLLPVPPVETALSRSSSSTRRRRRAGARSSDRRRRCRAGDRRGRRAPTAPTRR